MQPGSGGTGSPPHLAGPIELIHFEKSSDTTLSLRGRPVCADKGLLMPHFPCTLQLLPVLGEAAALKIGNQMKVRPSYTLLAIVASMQIVGINHTGL
jgi:hypothetical protein